MSNTKDIKYGATALVTGGASGIDLACVQRLVADGRRVVMVDKNQIALQFAMRGLDSTLVLPVLAELSDRASPTAVEAKVSRQGFGPVLVLVNNAGIAPKHEGRSHNLLAIDLVNKSLGGFGVLKPILLSVVNDACLGHWDFWPKCYLMIHFYKINRLTLI
jgi:NAD(P)-dependent dehydrogenase (short-subunit alcohol dehydrogenase family)